MVQINDAAYGGFILSKNAYKKGKPIGYSYREESSIPELIIWKYQIWNLIGKAFTTVDLMK